jgi:predicted acylesterase/phospholipase RssA
MESNDLSPLNPFGRIALSLSGGGFRAAAFNIGMMSFLHRVQVGDKISLLDRVVFMASASGGSFPAAFYGMYKLKGKPFEECFIDFLKLLSGDSLLQQALNTLNDDKQWSLSDKGKRRNLINAFAKVYDAQLFKGETFGVFEDQDPPIDFSVCFNSTEFYRGLSFRFQIDSSRGSREYLGSRSVYFKKSESDAYTKIKLGDILAASSCFPAGFEPIVWPHDFTYQDPGTGKSLMPEELENTIVLADYDMSTKFLKSKMGLMDGGINDNQALYSTMQADERKNGRYDLILVSDVASYFMDPYEEPTLKPEEGWRKKTLSDLYYSFKRKLKSISAILKGGFILSLAGIVASALCLYLKVGGTLSWIALGFSGGWFIHFAILLILKRRYWKINFEESEFQGYIDHQLERLNLGSNFSTGIRQEITSYLSRTKLGVLENMLKTRAYSVLIMAMDVNLKHVRRLIYEMFFENRRWDDRRLYNVIYELSSFNLSNREFRVRKRLGWKPTEEEQGILLNGTHNLQQVAESARNMGTTLWFDEGDEGKLRDIVACGQFTACSNLLEYVMSLERNQDMTARDKEKLHMVKQQLLDYWEQFKTNPYWGTPV